MGLDSIVGGIKAVGKGALSIGRWAVPITAIPRGEAREKTLDTVIQNYPNVSELFANPPEGYSRENLREILGYHLDNKYAHYYNLAKWAAGADYLHKALGPARTVADVTKLVGGVGFLISGLGKLTGLAGDVAQSINYGIHTGDYLGTGASLIRSGARVLAPFGLLNYTNDHLNRVKNRIRYEATRDFAAEFRKTAQSRQESLDTKFSPMPA